MAVAATPAMPIQALPTTEGDEFYGGGDFWLRDRRPRRRSSGSDETLVPSPACRACSLLASSRKDPKILSSNAGRMNGAIEAHCFTRRLTFAWRWHFARSESMTTRSDIFPKDRELDRAATLRGTRHLESLINQLDGR